MLTADQKTDTKISFAALLAQTIGHASNWMNVMPSYEKAQAAYEALDPAVAQRLATRAASHGMDPVELMRRIPQALWEDTDALDKFLSMMDVSHVKAQSTHPELADDPSNVVWEVKGTNRARGSDTMTGSEYSDANDTARDTARDLTGNQTWWDLNDVFKNMLDAAQALGYTLAWLPKSVWLEMMNTIKYELPRIDKEETFSGKFRWAKQFAQKIVAFFKKHKHQVGAAFMLALLTLWWPPAAFFVATWAISGVLSVASHLIGVVSEKLGAKHRFFRLLQKIGMAAKAFNVFVTRVRNFLDHIKNGIFTLATKAVDLFFGAVKRAVEVVKPFVVKIIKKAKSLLTGFINWIFGNRTSPAYA